MYKNLLPIGSVVTLKGEEQRYMICGRVACRSGATAISDYLGCPYPQGIMDMEAMRFFNRDAVEETWFIGFQDPQELQFRREVLDKLGELRVVNGAIVEKTDASP